MVIAGCAGPAFAEVYWGDRRSGGGGWDSRYPSDRYYRRSPNRDFFSPYFGDPTIVRRRPSIVTPFDSGKQAGYCGASARVKFDDEQFVALFNELQARGDKTKLMQLFGH